MAGIHPVDNIIKRQKWGWIEHTPRKHEQCIARQATMKWNTLDAIGRRKRGRWLETWSRAVETKIKSLAKCWPEVQNMAKLRNLWRIGVIDALCPARD